MELPPIVIKGYKFFNSETGENVLIKGIDYYPRPNAGDLDNNNMDFFTEQYRHIWERDISHFVELGVNAVRLYAVDPTKNHEAFMCTLNHAGIYVLVELASGTCPECSISSKESPLCYPKQLKTRGETIIREFSKYSNTLAFSAGNEVNHFVPMGKKPQWNAPCLKKFVSDMRSYVKGCSSSMNMRQVPIGLIMADSDRDENTKYYNCQTGDDDLEHAEWYGLNSYVYCNGTAHSFDEAAGFQTLIDSFESYNYSIPVLLTEFGCLSTSFPTIDGYEAQRSFNQAKWLGLPEVQNQFAGGLVFEYSIESANAHTPFPFKTFGQQNYGIGYFSPENCNDIDIPCEYNPTPSFYNLKNAYEQIQAENITLDSFELPLNRTGRTQCPKEFPPLSQFVWPSDSARSIRCPRRATASFSCPASNTPFITGDSEMPLLYIAIGICALFLLYLGFSKRIIESANFVTKALKPRDNDESRMLTKCNGSDSSSGYSSIDYAIETIRSVFLLFAEIASSHPSNMLTVFSKNFPKSKIIKTYKTSRQHETPVDSTQRPLQYIQEPTMDEEDREEDRRNNIKSNSFDGESLSTHDSIHFFHSKGILICNEEGKVLCDGRSEIGHVRSQDLDEQGQNEEEGKEKQTRYPDKYDDIDLSFHMEDSLLDSSDLYRVLDGVDEGEGLGNCRGTYDSPRLTNEDKVHFEAAFVNLGQVMFKNQPNRIASNSKCSSPVEGDVQKKLFDSWNRNILSRASTMALFLFGAACTYTFISILAPMKDRTTIPISENFTEQQDFAKEVFLQAMYMLSTFPQCSEEDVVLVPSQNFMSSFLPYTITLLMVPVFRRICNSKGENTSMKDEMCSPLIKKSPGSCKMEGSSLSRRKRLQREMASLDKGNIVSSTFITEIVTPTGELSSVKRSSRIGGRKMKDTIRSSSVNLTGVFHLEDGDSPSKTQVTLVSNK